MLLVAGEVAFARCEGANAVAERLDKVRGATGSRGFRGELRLNGLACEDGLWHATTSGQFGKPTIERVGKFAGEHTHAREVIPQTEIGNTLIPSAEPLWLYPSDKENKRRCSAPALHPYTATDIFNRTKTMNTKDLIRLGVACQPTARTE